MKLALIAGLVLLAGAGVYFSGETSQPKFLEAGIVAEQLPGSTFIGLGFSFNGAFGLCDSVLCAYDGFKSPVFKQNFTVPTTNHLFIGYNGKKYACPLGYDCKLVTKDTVKTKSAQAANLTSTDQFGQTHQHSLDEDYIINKNQINAFSKNLIDSVAFYNKTVIYNYHDVEIYLLNIKNQTGQYGMPDLDPTFAADVKNLPGDDTLYDNQPTVRASYASFIKKYGTHFVTNMTLGGRLETFYELDQTSSKYNSINETERNMFTTENFNKLAKRYDERVIVEDTRYNETAKFSAFKSLIYNFEQYKFGGSPSAADNTWVDSVATIPVPVDLRAEKIQTLFTSYYFKNLANINAKKIMMDQAINDFYNSINVTSCIRNCNNNGYCIPGAVFKIGVCQCNSGWKGADCSVPNA